MRILITGASGFIGQHTAAAARAAGHEVVTWSRADGDFDSPAACTALAGTDAVIHLAGRYPLRGIWAPTLHELFEVNAALTARLLDACARSGIGRVVLASTAQVYYPSRVTTPTESDPAPGRSAYGASKLCAEALVRAHGGTSLRLFNVFGPGQGPHNVLATIASQALTGGTVRILDDRPVRDFIHVADAARAFLRAATHPGPLPDAINVGSGEGTSIRALAQLILRVAGRSDQVEAVNRADAIVDTFVADISLARSALGWQPELTLEDGVIDVVSSMTATPASERGFNP